MTTKKLERRAFSRPIEVRTAEDGTISLRGYAAVFDSESYGEVVKTGAFNRTLAQRDDVRLLVNHEGVPIARSKSGTLTLSIDDVGLLVEAKGLDPANPTVQELVSAMARGDIDQMSFSFEALDAPTVNGVRELREVKLYDVSIVTYPWYEATSAELNGSALALVEARSAGRDKPQLKDRMRVDAQLRGAPPGMSSFNDVTDVVCDAICDRIEAITGLEGVWIWVADIGPGWAVYSSYGREYYQVAWELDDATNVVTLGEPFEVSRVVQWLPVTPENDPDPVTDPALSTKSRTVAEARALFDAA